MPSSRLVFQAMLHVAMVVAVIGIAQPAFAHTLSVTRGTAVVEGDVLTVHLEPNKHGESALTRLYIRDARGDGLAGIPPISNSANGGAKDHTLRYSLPPRATYVTSCPPARNERRTLPTSF